MKRHDTARNTLALALMFVGASLGAPRPAAAQNLRWGPVHMTLGASAGFEYTDNVNTSQNHPLSDYKLLLGPSFSGAITLPFAGGQQFTLSVALTYEKSLTGNSQDTFGAPLTATLILPVEIGHWSVVFGDSFNFTDDPLEKTFAFNRTKATEYSNTASLSVTRQFGRAALTLAAQRTDNYFPEDPLLEETIHQVSITPAYFFRDNYSVFLRNTAGWYTPTSPLKPDTFGYSSEVGVSGQITPSLSGSISIGYAHSTQTGVLKSGGSSGGIFGGIFGAPPTKGDENIDGISSTLALSYTQPLRPNTTHSISFYRSPGVTAVLQNSDITAVTGVSYSLAHRLNSRLTLTPSAGWSLLEDVGSRPNGERAHIIIVGVGLNRRFTEKLSGSATYRYQTRSSNINGNNYDVNRVDVSLNYSF